MPRSGPGSKGHGCPSIRKEPRLGVSTPNSILRNVVLPQPDAPTMVTNSWSSTLRLTFSSTTCPSNSFHRCLTVTCVTAHPSCGCTRPTERFRAQQTQHPVHGERQQSDPRHIRQDDVHCKVAPNQKNAISQTLGGCDCLRRDQK